MERRSFFGSIAATFTAAISLKGKSAEVAPANSPSPGHLNIFVGESGYFSWSNPIRLQTSILDIYEDVRTRHGMEKLRKLEWLTGPQFQLAVYCADIHHLEVGLMPHRSQPHASDHGYTCAALHARVSTERYSIRGTGVDPVDGFLVGPDWKVYGHIRIGYDPYEEWKRTHPGGDPGLAEWQEFVRKGEPSDPTSPERQLLDSIL